MERRTIKNGEKFGKWTVLSYNKIKKKYEVQCECGTIRFHAKNLFDGTGKKTVIECNDCFQTKPRPHLRLPDDLALKRRVLYNYKDAAARRGYEFLLTEEEFYSLIFQDCYHCGTSLSMINNEERFRGRVLKYNGVDRLDNSIGYTKENSVPCCKICNNSKSTLLIEEWENWIKRIYNFRFN